MSRPIALVFLLSLAALACTARDDPDPAPAAADEAAPLAPTPGDLPEARPRDADLALARRATAAPTAFVAAADDMTGETFYKGHVPSNMPLGTGGPDGVAGGTTGPGVTGGAGAPIVRQAAPAILGSISKDVIRRIVGARIADVRACYEEWIARDPGLTGKIVLHFTVGPTGAVTRAGIADSTLADAAVGGCLVRAARRWQFPSGPGGFEVFYPFIFEPN